MPATLAEPGYTQANVNIAEPGLQVPQNEEPDSVILPGSLFYQPLFRLIDPALVLNVKVAWGEVPTSPLAEAPVPEWFTVTGKLVLIEPTSVVAFTWTLVVPGKVISIDPALVSKSYVPVVIEPLKLIFPAFVLKVELSVSEAWFAEMLPALLVN